MQVRRLTRLTNAFNKRVENLRAALNLHFTHCNFVQFHGISHGHPTASLAYAWSYETDSGSTRYIAVRGLPPAKSARDAVCAAIVAQQDAKPADR